MYCSSHKDLRSESIFLNHPVLAAIVPELFPRDHHQIWGGQDFYITVTHFDCSTRMSIICQFATLLQITNNLLYDCTLHRIRILSFALIHTAGNWRCVLRKINALVLIVKDTSKGASHLRLTCVFAYRHFSVTAFSVYLTVGIRLWVCM